MGFVLGVSYLLTYYLTPTTVFGPLAEFRIELILAVMLVLASIPVLSRSYLTKTPQTFALAGLTVAVVLSVLIGRHWFAGSVSAFLQFVPNAFAYFLVCLHCNSKKRLQGIVLMLAFVCMFVIIQGSMQLRYVDPAAMDQDQERSYLLAQNVGEGESLIRLRGLGEINDPNDFAQLIVCVIPLMFIFWRPKRAFRNFAFVLVPVGLLLYGAFLTHSRGSMLAILAIAVVAARRRIGTLPSFMLAAGLFVAATALNFTGGRDISASAGSDRTALWGTGMQLIRSHPIFGVGFGNFVDYAGLTAHNSLVVCAAELGFLGLYFWTMFVFPSVRDALVIASPVKVSEAQAPVEVRVDPTARFTKPVEILDKSEFNRLGRLMVLSLTGFLVTAWFLSRAFVVTLFLLGGMTEVIFQLAYQQGMVPPRMPFGKILKNTGFLAISLVMLMYLLLRAVNLMH